MSRRTLRSDTATTRKLLLIQLQTPLPPGSQPGSYLKSPSTSLRSWHAQAKFLRVPTKSAWVNDMGEPMNAMWRRTATTAACLLALTAAGTTSALAAAPASVHPDRCGGDPGYDISSYSHVYKDMVPYAEAEGGQTVTITLTAGASVSATISASGSWSMSAILASAQATVGVSVTAGITASVAYSSSWAVPSSDKWGYLHAGADEEYVHWNYGQYNGNCTWVIGNSGTGNLPYHVPTFWHTT